MTRKNNGAEQVEYTLIVSGIERPYTFSDPHFIVRIGHITPEGNIRNLSSSLWTPDPLESLAMWATLQLKADSYNDPSYGWACEYRDVFAVTSQNVQGMARTLATLARNLDKMNDAEGYARTYGAYVARCARALGIKRAAILPGDPATRRGSYDDMSIQRGSLSDAAAHIDRAIAEHYAKVSGGRVAYAAVD